MYALADGAYFARCLTRPSSTKLRRGGGSSLYLPTLCIPMLPRRLSEDLMSLNANGGKKSSCLRYVLRKMVA